MYRKVISILVLFFSSLALITQISLIFLGKLDLNRDLLLTVESAINGIIGILAGIYLLQKNQRGLFLSKIWSALQIPIILYGVNGVIAFV